MTVASSTVYGRWSDRRGRKAGLLVGMMISSIGFLAVSFALISGVE